jgi:hypothetical protein
LSSWTSVSPGVSVLPAGRRLVAGVTIAVPRDASPGEQYGVIWAETRSTPPAGGGVTEVSRVGIRAYLSVGPGGPPPSNFTIESLSAARTRDGRPMVVASVRNTGGRALDMYGTLRLTRGPGGLRAGPFPASLGVTLAVGDTEPIHIVLDKRLPQGPWVARVTLHSGLITNSAQATLTFHDAPSGRTQYLTVLAIALLAITLVAIAALLAVIRRRRPLTPSARKSPQRAERLVG